MGHADFPLTHSVVWVRPGVAQRRQSPADWAQHTGAAAITCRAAQTDQVQLHSGSSQLVNWGECKSLFEDDATVVFLLIQQSRRNLKSRREELTHTVIRITHHYGGFATVLGPVWACPLVSVFRTFGTTQQTLHKSQRSKTCQTNK